MNISAARWGNQSAKLSFWATYLPTVSLLPPGDPAAVLNLETDKISWYPTDIAEYAHVGHYYLLNEEFDEAAEQYSDALRKIDRDDEEHRLLLSSIRLWRGIARLASGNEAGAAQDLSFVRENTVLPSANATETDDMAAWDERVLRDLATDREVLSTMLSMGQVQLAVDEAGKIIEADEDARRIQSVCYLALVYSSLGKHQTFTDHVVDKLIPAALESKQVPESSADALIAHYSRAIVDPANLRQLSNPDKNRFAQMLTEHSELTRTNSPKRAAMLLRSATWLYREAGATAAESDLLRTIAGM
jgi:tetratricopeptide (TPR) repeat protein